MKKELNIFDKPRNLKRLLITFFTLLVVLIVVDFFIPKHSYFHWDHMPQFFAVYGFLSYVLLVFVAKAWRHIVKRDEDYYDR